MNEKVKFLFFCMIFVGQTAFGQKTSSNPDLVFPNYKVRPLPFMLTEKGDTVRYACIFGYGNNKFSKYYKPVIKYSILKKTGFLKNKINVPLTFSAIPNNFYTQNFGFFCKKELQMEKIIKVPFKFRLGSVQQCDWMEGKKGAGIR